MACLNSYWADSGRRSPTLAHYATPCVLCVWVILRFRLTLPVPPRFSPGCSATALDLFLLTAGVYIGNPLRVHSEPLTSFLEVFFGAPTLPHCIGFVTPLEARWAAFTHSFDEGNARWILARPPGNFEQLPTRHKFAAGDWRPFDDLCFSPRFKAFVVFRAISPPIPQNPFLASPSFSALLCSSLFPACPAPPALFPFLPPPLSPLPPPPSLPLPRPRPPLPLF